VGTGTTALFEGNSDTYATTTISSTQTQSYTTTTAASYQTTTLTVTSLSGSTFGNVFDTIYVAQNNEVLYPITTTAAESDAALTQYASSTTSFVRSANATERQMLLVSTSERTTSTFTRRLSSSFNFTNSDFTTQTISVFGFPPLEDSEFELITWNIPEPSTTQTRSVEQSITASASSSSQTYGVVNYAGKNIDTITTTTALNSLATRTGLLGSVVFNRVNTITETTTEAVSHSATYTTFSTENVTGESASSAGGNTTTIYPSTYYGTAMPAQVSRSVFVKSGVSLEDQVGLIFSANKSISVEKALIGTGARYRIVLGGTRGGYTAVENTVTFTTTTQDEDGSAKTTDSAQLSPVGSTYVTLSQSNSGFLGGSAAPSLTIVNRADSGLYRTKNSAGSGTIFLDGDDTVLQSQIDGSFFEPLRYLVVSTNFQMPVVARNTSTYPSA
jgi:hypothetical protein